MRYAICSYKITQEIENNLMKLGLCPVKLYGCTQFGEYHPLSYHPDMFCFKLRDNTWIFYESAYKNNQEILDNFGLDIITVTDPISGEYPHYIGLNCARVGKYLICAAKYTHPLIVGDDALGVPPFNDFEIIDVKQGYAGCSTCVVRDAIITADRGIYEKFPNEKLLIEAGHIDLYGYNYGFIGGCTGYFDDKLLFTGDIKLHPDYKKIKDCCNCQGVELVSLSQERLKDYGGILIV